MSKNSKEKQPNPFPVFQLTITGLSNGGINVANFPEDYAKAMQILDAARNAVIGHFFQGIADNRYDAKGVNKGADILIAKPNQIIV